MIETDGKKKSANSMQSVRLDDIHLFFFAILLNRALFVAIRYFRYQIIYMHNICLRSHWANE